SSGYGLRPPAHAHQVGQVDGNEFSIPVESNERSVAIEEVHGRDDGVSKLAGILLPISAAPVVHPSAVGRAFFRGEVVAPGWPPGPGCPGHPLVFVYAKYPRNILPQNPRGLASPPVLFRAMRVLIKSQLATGSMSALAHFADPSRTSREVREVPLPDMVMAQGSASARAAY